MTRISQRSLLCTLILAGLSACAGSDLPADPTASGTTGAAAAAAAPSTKATTAAGTWSRIGNEWDTLTVPANTTVRYGANGAYVEKLVSGSFRATNDFFGADPAPGVYKQVEAFAPEAAATTVSTTGTWNAIGNEWDTLNVPTNSTVRYGANGAYVQRVVSGTFRATNDFFGSDPAPGVYKRVELLGASQAAAASVAAPAAAPAASPAAAPAGGSWVGVGREWDTVTVGADTTVRYGANGAYVQKVVSGTFRATNEFFGSDPAPGVYKQVEALVTAGSATSQAATTAAAAGGRVLRVGPGQAFTRIADAAAIAQDGDTVEIQAGTYWGDVAVWRQNNLTIRGVGGRPVLDANGAHAQGKGIFVVSGANTTIDNLEFTNAKVPDQNGAGIRFEGGNLTVRNTVFRSNEQGILTVSNPTASLEVHDSQFIGNAFAYSGGYAHSIYVGQIGRFVVQGTYFTRTESGHLIKSRARENYIAYNRITDEAGGSASYEVNLPNGGVTYLVGNLIEQGANTGNPVIVSYGEEGMGVWPSNQFHAVNNTVVNRRGAGCTWMRTPAGTGVKVMDNLLLGSNCRFELPGDAQVSNNLTVSDADFADTGNYDFRLRAGSAARGAWANPGSANGVSLMPSRQYVHPGSSAALSQPVSNPGATQSVL